MLELSDKSSRFISHCVCVTASIKFERVDTYTGSKRGCEILESDVSSTVTHVDSSSVIVILTSQKCGAALSTACAW